MPILWMASEAATTGVIGAAEAHLAELEGQLGTLLLSTGALIMGGINYIFGGLPYAPPTAPSCTAIPSSWLGGYTGGESDDVIDLTWDSYVDVGDGGGDEPPPA